MGQGQRELTIEWKDNNGEALPPPNDAERWADVCRAVGVVWAAFVPQPGGGWHVSRGEGVAPAEPGPGQLTSTAPEDLRMALVRALALAALEVDPERPGDVVVVPFTCGCRERLEVECRATKSGAMPDVHCPFCGERHLVPGTPVRVRRLTS